MALVLQTIDVKETEADVALVNGKHVRAFDTYSNALANTTTGLVAIESLDVLTGNSGGAITQDATCGLAVDSNGMLNFFVDDANAEIYLYPISNVDLETKVPVNSFGRWGGPLRVVVA